MTLRHRFLIAISMLPAVAMGQQEMDHSQHHNMRTTGTGVVMNENTDVLPRGCKAISQDHEFTVEASRKFATKVPGTIFGMSNHEWQVEPCSRITVTFVNQDEVRHQWMVHGLPKYLYPTGMFHIEAMGGQSQTGTFIVPGDSRNYLVHCDMAQHMEKGMRGQLIVGKGGGDLWGVTGVTDAFYRFSYLPQKSMLVLALTLVGGFLLTLFLIGFRKKE